MATLDRFLPKVQLTEEKSLKKLETTGKYLCKFNREPCFTVSKFQCVHGGGVACVSWCRLTDREITTNPRLLEKVGSGL